MTRPEVELSSMWTSDSGETNRLCSRSFDRMWSKSAESKMNAGQLPPALLSEGS